MEKRGRFQSAGRPPVKAIAPRASLSLLASELEKAVGATFDKRQASESGRAIMIWLFERGDRIARLITRFDAGSAEYVLEMEWSDGLNTTERFTDFAAFQARIITLEHKLLSEEWKQSAGSPQLISEDWWKP